MITITSVRVDTSSTVKFTGTDLARLVKVFGGSWSECRGYNMKRFVTIPMNKDGSAELFELALRTQRQGRERCLVFQTSNDLIAVGSAYVDKSKSIVMHPAEQYTAAQILSSVEKHATIHAEQQLLPGVIGWGGDPRVLEEQRKHAISALRRRIEQAEKTIQESNKALDELLSIF